MKNTFSSSTVPLPKHSALPEPNASLLLDLPCEQQLVEALVTPAAASTGSGSSTCGPVRSQRRFLLTECSCTSAAVNQEEVQDKLTHRSGDGLLISGLFSVIPLINNFSKTCAPFSFHQVKKQV